MRILICLISKNRITIKQSYNNIIQGLIYNFLDKIDATWLHDHGFESSGRKFKLFVFSGIREIGRVNRTDKTFEFSNRISFYLSSPVDWILTQFAGNIFKTQNFNFGNNIVSIESVGVMKKPKIDRLPLIIKAITPIEVHSTITKPDGKKLTYYYNPFEYKFSSLINDNLKKKWKAFYKYEPTGDISIKPLFKGNKNERIRYFVNGGKKTVIKGWQGIYEIDGNKEMIKFAYDAGLGSRNSQGFGMVETMRLEGDRV